MMALNMRVLFGVLWTMTNFCSAQTSSNMSSLNNTLFNSFQTLRSTLIHRLKKRLKVPPKYQADIIPIFLHHEPFQIIQVDEVFQAITISSMVTLVWKDLNVYWDPDEFSGIEALELPADLFWTPSVIVPKTTQIDYLQIRLPDNVLIASTGFVTANIPALINSLCDFDMTDFPFDTHNCSIVFLESDFYNLTFQEMPPLEIGKHFGTNAAWMLLSHDCIATQTHTVTIPFYYISCNVLMSRRSTFFVANLIAPMVMTSLMTLMVFWMPAQEGEKISFLVSIFTSTSVFLNYIVDMLPRSMESLPQLNFLLFAIDLQVILATVATAFVLRRFKEEEEERHHNHPEQKKWLWLWRGQQKLRALLQFMKPIRQKNRNFFLSLSKNTVHPDQILAAEIDSPTIKDHNIREIDASIEGKYGGFDYEKCIINDSKVFLVNNEVPGPSEYIPPEEDLTREGCMKCRLNHEELDMLFFVLMLLLTIAVYFYAFVS